MAQIVHIHADNPQVRLLRQAAAALHQGKLLALPTDASYVLAGRIGDKAALQQLRRVRQLPEKHQLTLMCRDLSEIAHFARVENYAYRLVKAHTPGPYTFIFRASKEVPRRLVDSKKKTIGIRVPACNIALSLLAELDEPILCTTLIPAAATLPLIDPYDIETTMGHELAMILDGGNASMEVTTVVDFTAGGVQLVRAGLGTSEDFQ